MLNKLTVISYSTKEMTRIKYVGVTISEGIFCYVLKDGSLLVEGEIDQDDFLFDTADEAEEHFKGFANEVEVASAQGAAIHGDRA